MANVVVNNGVISFTTPTIDGAVITGPAPFETTIPVSSSSDLKGEGKAAALSPDIMAVTLNVTAYTWAAYTIPGTGIVTIVSIISGVSTKVTKNSLGVILDTAVGLYMLTPIPGAGAQIPGGPFDTTPHSGNWSIGNANQTKLTSTG